MKNHFCRLVIILMALASISTSCVFEPLPVPSSFHFAGKLLLFRSEPEGEKTVRYPGDAGVFNSYNVELYEYQQGMEKPVKVNDPGFDVSKIAGKIIGISPTKQYLIFYPHNLINLETGEITTLPLPERNDQDLSVYYLSFSPDGSKLAYVVGQPYGGVFVLNLDLNDAVQVYQADCTQYLGMNGITCAGIGELSWIDDQTLMFSHRLVLPYSYKLGGGGDGPYTFNHVTVVTANGDSLLSMESPKYDEYHAAGGVVFRYSVDSVDAWLDGNALLKGVYEPHLFSELGIQEPYVRTCSPDGRYLLNHHFVSQGWLHIGTPPWHLVEVQPGKDTPLGTKFEVSLGGSNPNPPIKECFWSPDAADVACFLLPYEQLHPVLFIVPLSQEQGTVIFTEENDDIRWDIFNWEP